MQRRREKIFAVDSTVGLELAGIGARKAREIVEIEVNVDSRRGELEVVRIYNLSLGFEGARTDSKARRMA